MLKADFVRLIVASVALTLLAATSARAELFDGSFASFTQPSTSTEALIPNMIGGGHTLRQPFLAPVQDGAVLTNNYYHRHFSRVSENNSPLPRTRIAFAYKLLGDVQTFSRTGGGPSQFVDRELHEYTLQYEQAMFDGLLSAEFIVPVQHSTDQSQTLAVENGGSSRMGNLAFGMKTRLCENDWATLSGGLRVEAPTSSDQRGSAAPILTFRNDQSTWFLTPYLASLFQAGDFFVQNFVSYRIATAGETITFMPAAFGTSDIRETDLLMVDTSFGYFLYKDTEAPVFTSLAAMVELAYLTTPAPCDAPLGHTDNLDLTVGMTSTLCNHATITFGFAFPLRDTRNVDDNLSFNGTTDRFFEWSFIAQVNVFAL